MEIPRTGTVQRKYSVNRIGTEKHGGTETTLDGSLICCALRAETIARVLFLGSCIGTISSELTTIIRRWRGHLLVDIADSQSLNTPVLRS
jgi:hypothetical protein